MINFWYIFNAHFVSKYSHPEIVVWKLTMVFKERKKKWTKMKKEKMTEMKKKYIIIHNFSTYTCQKRCFATMRQLKRDFDTQLKMQQQTLMKREILLKKSLLHTPKIRSELPDAVKRAWKFADESYYMSSGVKIAMETWASCDYTDKCVEIMERIMNKHFTKDEFFNDLIQIGSYPLCLKHDFYA